MNYSYEKDKRGVATLTLNRPHVHNAFDDTLIENLTEVFRSMQEDKTLRLVVFTGAGKSFSAGADINWMKKTIHYSEEENRQDARSFASLLELMNHCPVPMIGKINGAALGGGVGLVSVCDYALASSEAVFGLTEVRLGLVPAVVGPFVVAKIGQAQARAVFLSGERFDAQKALHWGLVHAICSPKDLGVQTEEMIGQFLKAGPMAVREAKKLIGTLSRNLDHTWDLFARLRISEEAQKGMSAMLEKRPPPWVEE